MNLQDAHLTLKDIDLGGIDAESDYRLSDYFVTTPYVKSALAGQRTLLLGRKGSGKSALFTQLTRLIAEGGQASTEVISLTPDQYAWSALKNYEEQGILPEQAHADAWKLTLAIELAARLVATDNGDLSGPAADAMKSLKQFLKDNYGAALPDLPKTAASLIKGLRQFNLSAFGFGIGMHRDADEGQSLTPTVVNTLYDVLELALADSTIVIALDRLDDSWDGSEKAQSLLIGLLKASKELNDRFSAPTSTAELRVLVFLRSDIYDSLEFDDKDKHRPTEEHIVWRPAELKSMIDRRLPSNISVDELFEAGDMRGSISPFNYIVKRTFLRPREVLQFLAECIRQAGPLSVIITKDQIRAAEELYSGWKVADLKQEYAKAFPEFGALLECLRQGIHRYDSIGHLEVLISTKAPDLVTKHGVRELLERLFDASVIGVRLGDSGSPRFKAEDSELALPSSGAVYVHQSVYRGLKIRETRRSASDEVASGNAQDRLTIELYSRMMKALPIQDLTFLTLNPTPLTVFQNESFAGCAAALGRGLSIDEDGSVTTAIARPNIIFRERFDGDSLVYTRLRADMLGILGEAGLPLVEYEAGELEAQRTAKRVSGA